MLTYFSFLKIRKKENQPFSFTFQPATVSRCGMIYLEPRVLGWRPIVESWVNGEIAEPLRMYKNDILALFDFLVPQCLGKISLESNKKTTNRLFYFRSCSTRNQRIKSIRRFESCS